MAEVLGVAGAGIAFLQLFQTSTSLYRRFASASDDLKSITDDINGLETFCRKLSAENLAQPDFVPVDIIEMVLALAKDFRSQTARYVDDVGVRKRDRLRFVARDLPRLERLQNQAQGLTELALKYLVKYDDVRICSDLH